MRLNCHEYHNDICELFCDLSTIDVTCKIQKSQTSMFECIRSINANYFSSSGIIATKRATNSQRDSVKRLGQSSAAMKDLCMHSSENVE